MICHCSKSSISSKEKEGTGLGSSPRRHWDRGDVVSQEFRTKTIRVYGDLWCLYRIVSDVSDLFLLDVYGFREDWSESMMVSEAPPGLSIEGAEALEVWNCRALEVWSTDLNAVSCHYALVIVWCRFRTMLSFGQRFSFYCSTSMQVLSLMIDDE